MTTNQSDMTNDPRPAFASVVSTARDIVAAVTPADLTRSTPCSEFDVEQLLGHILIVLRRVAALGRGDDPMAMPTAVSGIGPDGWLGAFDADADQAIEAWADDAVLDRTMVLPWAQLSGRQMLPTYTSELTVHTWDLATAIDADVAWDTDAVDAALASALTLLPPAPRSAFALPNGMPAPFDEPVEIDPAAPTIDRLVAWYGRNPN